MKNHGGNIPPLPPEFSHLEKVAEDAMKTVLMLEKAIAEVKEPGPSPSFGGPPPLSKAARQAEFKRQQFNVMTQAYKEADKALEGANADVRIAVLSIFGQMTNYEEAIAREKASEERKNRMREEIRDTRIFDRIVGQYDAINNQTAENVNVQADRQGNGSESTRHEEELKKPSKSSLFTMSLRYDRKLFEQADKHHTQNPSRTSNEEEPKKEMQEKHGPLSDLYSKSLSYNLNPVGGDDVEKNPSRDDIDVDRDED